MTRDCRRCDWAGDDLAAHAIEAGHPMCVVCHRSLAVTELQTCLRCVGLVRSVLVEIVDLYAMLPAVLVRLSGQRMDADQGSTSEEAALPGGDALVMLAGGGSGAGEPGDPPAVAFELGTWEDDWRHVRHEPAADCDATVCGAARYLGVRLGWAASHHPAFDEFAADLRRIVSRLRTVTATDDRPERGAPCFECDTPLERRSGEESYRCPRCRRIYDGPEYVLAVAQRYALARRGLVPAVTLAALFGIQEERLRQWATRGKVSRRGTDERGRTLYDAEEVREYAVIAGVLAIPPEAVSQ